MTEKEVDAFKCGELKSARSRASATRSGPKKRREQFPNGGSWSISRHHPRLTALRREGPTIGAWNFLKLVAVVMLPALGFTLAVLLVQ
ncbi:hypothetical protein FHW16_002849 [Phyllobacterium myrsinacearum]|uniref:Uncharacterized protein n=1 Tax=Phyllobacterium myrsinacearum TaxID=28101 RepID=A0A839EGN3_9HYPH|nr:hypothetical protein [Phyllobacterium myrsinacearum]